MKLQDLHMHSNFSWDCDMELDKIADIALNKNIDTIAITDHVEIYHTDSALKNYHDYSDRSEQIKALNQYKMRVLNGAEVSEPYMRKSTLLTLGHKNVDMIIGSIHSMDKKSKSEEQIKLSYDEYYERNLKAVLTGYFDVLGHLGYIDRYYDNYEYENKQMIDDVLSALIEKDIVLEINTSAKRRKNEETFPKFEVIKRYRELGGQKVTIGSDAHRYEEIADNLSVGYEIARELDLEVGSFQKRKWIRI